MLKSINIFLVIILLTIYNVSSSRTCVCAQFQDDSCNSEALCVWNSREYAVGFVKGDHGICRSEKWMACHTDTDCQIEGNNPEGNNKGHPVRRRLLPEDMDWPYDCESGPGGGYYQYAINVRPYELLAKRGALNDAYSDNNNGVTSSMIAKLFGLAIFGTLIGVAVCWKYKNNKKEFGLNTTTNPGESYQTFV